MANMQEKNLIRLGRDTSKYGKSGLITLPKSWVIWLESITGKKKPTIQIYGNRFLILKPKKLRFTQKEKDKLLELVEEIKIVKK